MPASISPIFLVMVGIVRSVITFRPVSIPVIRVVRFFSIPVKTGETLASVFMPRLITLTVFEASPFKRLRQQRPNSLTKLVDFTGTSKERFGPKFSSFYKILAERSRKRSEEHTSELQLRPHLVCRLLLEK